MSDKKPAQSAQAAAGKPAAKPEEEKKKDGTPA